MSTLMTRPWKRSGSTFRRSGVITRLTREELKERLRSKSEHTSALVISSADLARVSKTFLYDPKHSDLARPVMKFKRNIQAIVRLGPSCASLWATPTLKE